MYATWTPKSKLFSTHERTSTTLEAVAARRENYADKTQYEMEEYEDDDTDILPSVQEAKRQNALFKQREMERLQHELNDINSRLRVEREHYQQWARSPVRRSTNTVLYRGIQQLKARAAKDEFEKSDGKKVSFSNDEFGNNEDNDKFVAQMYQTRMVPQHPNISQSHPQSCILRRQRTADSGFSRYSSYGRSPLKVPNAVVHVLSDGSTDKDGPHGYERKIGSSRSLEQGVIKPRYTRITNRERFPLAVNTPKCFDDHSLVVHQPIKSSDPVRQNSRLDLKELDSSHDKHDYRLRPLDSKHESGNETLTHKGSYFGNFAPRKLLATIRLAELYDFSSGHNHSHSAELRYLERQLTDPNLLMRGSKVVKWVPNLQRMGEKN